MTLMPWKRLGSHVIDMLVVASVAFIFSVFVSPLWPFAGLFDERPFVVSISAGYYFIVWLYHAFGIAGLANTYGRCVLKIQVVDMQSGARPTYKQAWRRHLALGAVVPINLAMLWFKENGRHLADMVSDTHVVAYDPNISKRMRWGPLIICVVFAFWAIAFAVLNG